MEPITIGFITTVIVVGSALFGFFINSYFNSRNQQIALELQLKALDSYNQTILSLQNSLRKAEKHWQPLHPDATLLHSKIQKIDQLNANIKSQINELDKEKNSSQREEMQKNIQKQLRTLEEMNNELHATLKGINQDFKTTNRSSDLVKMTQNAIKATTIMKDNTCRFMANIFKYSQETQRQGFDKAMDVLKHVITKFFDFKLFHTANTNSKKVLDEINHRKSISTIQSNMFEETAPSLQRARY